MSVIAPITSDMETKGYVAIHYSMTNLYQSRSSILFIMQVIFLLCYAATSLLLWAYSHYIRKPLARIMKGASEYAGGNLAYKIDVTSDDEMGYLAKTLNYMSDELNKNGEYQRKFIANVSHDFRSPLTSIKGYVNAILDGTIPYEMQERYLKIIAFESERLEKLTLSLLTLNELDMKKRMMHIQRFDVNDTIKTQQLHLKASAPAARSVWSYFSPDMNFMSELIWNRFSRFFTIFLIMPLNSAMIIPLFKLKQL